jgi:hypothetical protein
VVIERPQGPGVVLCGCRHLARDERAAAVRADDHSASDVALPVSISDPGSGDPALRRAFARAGRAEPEAPLP